MERARSRSDTKTDNFKVGVRVRPPLQKESAGTLCVHLEHGGVSVYRDSLGSETRGRSASQALIDVTDLASLHHPDSRPQTYFYDSLFGTGALQEEVYSTCAQHVVLSVLEGYNGSIIAYGQTGTGKTYTIEGAGSEGDRGVVPRCSEEIFNFIQNRADTESKFLVRISFLEIYNERLLDLLDSSQDKLRVREDGSGCTFVEGLSEHVVKGTMDVNRLLRKGSTARTTDGSRMNRESSRSHAVFTMVVERSGGRGVTIGKLRLVDLAGSERYDVEAEDKHLIETKNINTSLTAFGKVVLALTTPGSYSYIPYRDSKLTRILQDSLGGNSKTFLVCTVSPMPDCYLETLSTLNFAKRAKYIQNRAVVNQDFSKKAMLSSYEKEIARLHRELIESREGWVCAGELERVKQEKERAESEKQEVLHQLGRHREQVHDAELDRESFEKRIQELEQLVLKGGDRGGNKSHGQIVSPKTELVSEREALEEERRRLEKERQVFAHEKDSFLRARTAPDGQTGSDEEDADAAPRFHMHRASTSSSISSLRSGQLTPATRQSLWPQSYSSLYTPGARSHQGWVGYSSSVPALYDPTYRKALSSYVTALTSPKTGIPCKQFDNGLSVFSGSHAVQWFMENMEGVVSVTLAAEVGQKLLNLLVFTSMDGTPHFVPSDTAYYRFSHEYTPVPSRPTSRLGAFSSPVRQNSAVPSLSSQQSKSLSPEPPRLSPLTSDHLSTNTYSLLSDTSSVSSYASYSSATRGPLVDRIGWSRAGPSLMHLLASQGNRSLLKKLLSSQDPDELDSEGRSPLMYAAVGDQLKCAELLIKSGAAANLADRSGNSALHHAAQHGRDQLVRLLLRSSGSPGLQNKEGKNALHLCAELEGSFRCLEFLCKHSSSSRAINERDGRLQSPLHISVFANLPLHTRVLLMARAKLSVCDAEGRTPLHYAVTANALPCLQAILENCGRYINISDTSGWSPLHLACHDGTTESVHLLVSSKHCDVNLLDLHAASPLHNCVFANRPDLIKKLMEAGAVASCVDKSKKAPLHYAIERGYTECAHMLQRCSMPQKGKSLLHTLKSS